MKAAVILYGHMRTFEQCASALFEHFINPLGSDVFIHTWDVCESQTPSWHNEHNTKEIHTDHSLVNKIYNPVNYIIETQPIYRSDEDSIGPNNISMFGSMRMFESLYKSNQLKVAHELKNNFVYDIVLKIRPDIMLYSPLYANKLIPHIQDGHFLYGSNNTRAIDIINICTSRTMDNVCEIYTATSMFSKVDFFRNYLKCISVEMIDLNFNYGKHWTILRESVGND
jgi:hypothetical protein